MKLKYHSAYYTDSLAIFIIAYFFFLFSLLIKFSVIIFLIVVLSFFKFVYDITLVSRIRKNWNRTSGYIVGSGYYCFTRRKQYLKSYYLKGLADGEILDICGVVAGNIKDFMLYRLRMGHGVKNNKAYKYVVSVLSHNEYLGDGQFWIRNFPVDVYEHNGKYFFDIESIDLSKESIG